MINRLTLLAILATTAVASAQQTNLPVRKSIETAIRSVRLDVPMKRNVRKAITEGTRDFSGRPGPNYWQLEADYTIEASLDPSTQTITGTEKIQMHNNSKDDLSTIMLRLDHNIFRATSQRGAATPAEITEGMVLTSLKIGGKVIDLNAPYASGRDGNPPAHESVSDLTGTLARVNLVDRVKAGTTVEIEIAWNTKLPGGNSGKGHRMTQRISDKLFQPTQWYPRLAKYDDLRGWETNPYLGPAEFYNNFGRFDVYLTVPGGWIVSGTGILQNPQEVLTGTARQRLATVLNSDDEVMIVDESEKGPGRSTAPGDKLTWHFVAEKVNDFAWATAENFVWKATRATIPGKGPIPIHMLYRPEKASSFALAGKIARHALEFYSTLWAPYPFPQLTMQDGPSAGMEYPMVINSNQGAADHETAHQWWPMMVGTNESRYGWMDEGFNQYMNILSAADSRKVHYNLDGLGNSYGRISQTDNEAPMMWNATDSGFGYLFQTYYKTPLMLSMLGEIVGDDAVIEAMKKYTAAWAFKHPSPWDYMFFMNNELGQNLEWFWYYWLFTTESVEGSIQNVKTLNGKTIVTVHQAGEMPSPIVLKVEFESKGSAIKKSANLKIIDANTVIVTYPVSVWFNGKRNFDAVMDFGQAKIKKITLDPHGRFPDINLLDNVWPKAGK